MLPKVFDPFFTTKEVGQGAGLGLSAVLGIVKRAGGHVVLESQPGAGTTAAAYLPVAAVAGIPGGPEAALEPNPASTGQAPRILLAEDETDVRRLAAGALRRGGFEVLDAADGELALRILRAQSGTIALVFTDVMRPRMDGVALGRNVRELSLRLPIVFMSGYADAVPGTAGEREGEHAFIRKPFQPDALLALVQQQLLS